MVQMALGFPVSVLYFYISTISTMRVGGGYLFGVGYTLKETF